MSFKRPEPNEYLRNLALNYCRFVCLPDPVEGHYVPVNPWTAEAIAVEYERLRTDASLDIWVSAAYKALLNELTLQWHYLQSAEYIMEPWTGEGQPYADSNEMAHDVREYQHLYFFTGGEPHPFLGETTETGYTGNEMLRAVHDIFGHATEGYGFGARGEENAWLHHSMMFGPLAQQALSTETRGQNSWVNFGPHKDLPACERPYAEQKVDLLPQYLIDWREALEREEVWQ